MRDGGDVPRRLPHLVLAVTAALVLALALLGPAQAASVTAKQVKKIAAKVVDKKAGSLSVAKAATADTATGAATAATAANATALAGRPASAYLSGGVKYTLVPTGTSASPNWTFPGLAPGTYLASYSLTLDTPSSSPLLSCRLLTNDGAELSAYQTTMGTNRGSLTASGIVSVTPATTLSCAGNGVASSAVVSSASFVRLDEVTPRSAQPAAP